ncbi:hypothetical protein [Flavobacterium sp. AJR]|uniref:hypothetical protein n=1 Tax=Flavobacterium sp. AJR TaxID=1979369 RepID=UPI00057F3C52|nr:hypothetical protein [Flavobacterium sp. AJR]KIA96056.1 hypothetical protein OA93_17245 [Flavobacterium sp. KMS]
MNLKEKLNKWTDMDIAIHHIAVELSLFETDNFPGYLWIQWTENKYNDFLKDILQKLIELNMLEINENEGTIRYNKNFEIETKP